MELGNGQLGANIENELPPGPLRSQTAILPLGKQNHFAEIWRCSRFHEAGIICSIAAFGLESGWSFFYNEPECWEIV
jgi:hypothetical protein